MPLLFAMSKADHRFFYLLDGIRGVASLLIVVRHTKPFFLPLYFQESYLAVDVFFLLSGVVICNAYEQRLKSGMTALQFAKIRLIRIYPLYLLGLVLGTAAVYLWPDGGLPVPHLALAAILALFIIPYPLTPTSIFPLNNPAWSLFVELIGNFGYSLMVRRLTARILALTVAASAVGLIVTLATHGSHDLNAGFTIKGSFSGFFRFGYSFFAGVALYRRFLSRKHAEIKSGVLAWLILAITAGLLMVFLSAAVQPYYDFIVVTLVFPAIIYFALLIQPDRISAKLYGFFGAISYAIYVLHEPLGRLIAGTLAVAGIDVTTYAPRSGILLIILLVAMCWLVDKIYDGPVRRYLLKVDDKNGAQRKQTVPVA